MLYLTTPVVYVFRHAICDLLLIVFVFLFVKSTKYGQGRETLYIRLFSLKNMISICLNTEKTVEKVSQPDEREGRFGSFS